MLGMMIRSLTFLRLGSLNRGLYLSRLATLLTKRIALLTIYRIYKRK
jgi:hypothetical protein